MAYKLTNSKLKAKFYNAAFGLHEYEFDCSCMKGSYSAKAPLGLRQKFNCEVCGEEHMYLVTSEKCD